RRGRDGRRGRGRCPHDRPVVAVDLPDQRADRRCPDRGGRDLARRHANRSPRTARPRRRAHGNGGPGRARLRGRAERRPRLGVPLLPRAGVRPLVLAGCACFLAGFGWLTQAHVDTGYVTGVLGPTLLVAAGIGLTFPTLVAAATADAPDGDAGIVGGLANTA